MLVKRGEIYYADLSPLSALNRAVSDRYLLCKTMSETGIAPP